jgi:hypothetical protein
MSIGYRQAHTATSSDFDETFRIWRALGGDNFGDKYFED